MRLGFELAGWNQNNMVAFHWTRVIILGLFGFITGLPMSLSAAPLGGNPIQSCFSQSSFKEDVQKKPTLVIRSFGRKEDSSHSGNVEPDVNAKLGERIAQAIYLSVLPCSNVMNILIEDGPMANVDYELVGDIILSQDVDIIKVSPKLLKVDRESAPTPLNEQSIFLDEILQAAEKIGTQMIDAILKDRSGKTGSLALKLDRNPREKGIIAISCFTEAPQEGRKDSELPRDLRGKILERLMEGTTARLEKELKYVTVVSISNKGLEFLDTLTTASPCEFNPPLKNILKSGDDFDAIISGQLNFNGSNLTFLPQIYLRGFSKEAFYELPEVHGDLLEIFVFLKRAESFLVDFSGDVFASQFWKRQHKVSALEAVTVSKIKSPEQLVGRGIEKLNEGEDEIAAIYFDFAINNGLNHKLLETSGRSLAKPGATESEVNNSHLSLAYYYKAVLFQNRGEKQKEGEYLALAIDFNRNNKLALERLAMVFENDGKISEAIELYESVLSNEGDNVDLHKKLGRLYYATRDFKLAEKEYRLVLQGNSDDSEAIEGLYGSLMSLANQGFKQCHYDAIKHILKEAIKLKDGTLDWAHLNLTELYLLTDEPDKAKLIVGKYVKENNPGESRSSSNYKTEISEVLWSMAKTFSNVQHSQVEVSKLEKLIPIDEWDFRFLIAKLASMKELDIVQKDKVMDALAEINGLSPFKEWVNSEKDFFSKCLSMGEKREGSVR